MSGYFTVAEANEMLPVITELLENAKKKKAELDKAARLLQIGSFNLKEYVARKQQLNRMHVEFFMSVERLEATGVTLKGLEDGLVDFPAERFGEEVWLCWRYGEEEIKFWHEADSGFSGRKPLAVDDASLV